MSDPHPQLVPQPPPPGRPGSASPQDASTATRGRRHAARPGDPRRRSQVPRQRGGGGLETPPPGAPGAAAGPPSPGPGTSSGAARTPPPLAPTPTRPPASVRLGFPFLCLAAPRARPRRRRRRQPLTILQMEAMFRTVISLKVAAIPHRHLYKVKTGLSMVERSQGGRAAAGRRPGVRLSVWLGEGGREGGGGGGEGGTAGRAGGERRAGIGGAREPGPRPAARGGRAARARRVLPAPCAPAVRWASAGPRLLLPAPPARAPGHRARPFLLFLFLASLYLG